MSTPFDFLKEDKQTDDMQSGEFDFLTETEPPIESKSDEFSFLKENPKQVGPSVSPEAEEYKRRYGVYPRHAMSAEELETPLETFMSGVGRDVKGIIPAIGAGIVSGAKDIYKMGKWVGEKINPFSFLREGQERVVKEKTKELGKEYESQDFAQNILQNTEDALLKSDAVKNMNPVARNIFVAGGTLIPGLPVIKAFTKTLGAIKGFALHNALQSAANDGTLEDVLVSSGGGALTGAFLGATNNIIKPKYLKAIVEAGGFAGIGKGEKAIHKLIHDQELTSASDFLNMDADDWSNALVGLAFGLDQNKPKNRSLQRQIIKTVSDINPELIAVAKLKSGIRRAYPSYSEQEIMSWVEATRLAAKNKFPNSQAPMTEYTKGLRFGYYEDMPADARERHGVMKSGLEGERLLGLIRQETIPHWYKYYGDTKTIYGGRRPAKTTYIHELMHDFWNNMMTDGQRAFWEKMYGKNKAKERFSREVEHFFERGETITKELQPVVNELKQFIDIDKMLNPDAYWNDKYDSNKQRVATKQFIEDLFSIRNELPSNAKQEIQMESPSFAKSATGVYVPPDILRKDSLKSIDPEVELRYQSAHGFQRPKPKEKLKTLVQHIRQSMFRKFTTLDPKDPIDAQVSNVLRVHESIPLVAQKLAKREIKNIIGNLDKNQYNIFERVVVLEDLARDVERGLYKDNKLPFGYEPGTLNSDLNNFRIIADANPKIREALATRKTFMDTLRNQLVDAGVLPEEARNNDAYFHHQVLAHMQMRKWIGYGTTAKTMKETKVGAQRRRTGSAKDYNTDYLESEAEVLSQEVAQLLRAESRNRVDEFANRADFFKKQAKQLGVDDWRDVMPEDYTTWKPKEGNTLFETYSLPEKVVERFIAGDREIYPEDIKKIIALGKSKEWAIPKSIAEALDKLKPFDVAKEGAIAKASSRLLSGWKQWVLLNPYRQLKYNINNMSGDMDIVLAYNPKIIKYMRKSAKELWNYHKKDKWTPEIEEALKEAVIETGLTQTEIPDIRKENIFKSITNAKEGLVQKYWRNTKDFTVWRENILRLAAFKHFKSEMAKGKYVYGASTKEKVDAIKDPIERSALLARELIGDYGNISEAGQWLRRRMIPFWSFQEINLPRYVRMFKNLASEGRRTGMAKTYAGLRTAGRVAYKGTKLGIMANLMYGMVRLWNQTMFPDESDDLSDEYKRQGHLILGRNQDGSIQTIRMSGALTDALEWFGLEDYPKKIKDVVEGKSTIKDIISESIEAPLKKIVTGSRPEPKLLFETLTKKSLYPDPLRPSPIRDIGEHISRVFAVDPLYREASGVPQRRGPLESLSPTYDTHPGETAYWKARSLEVDFLKKIGKDRPMTTPTEKSNALYFYKKALRYGDEKLASKYLKKYINLGGTSKGYDVSMKKTKPIGLIPKKRRDEFIASLTPEERDIVLRALDWFKTTYGNR